jgi:hypothetical protein
VEAHEHEHDHDHDHDHDHEHDHDHDEDVEVVDAPDPVLADTDESGESADAASDTDGTEENA